MPIASNIIKFGKQAAQKSIKRQALKSQMIKKGKVTHKVFSDSKKRRLSREWEKLAEAEKSIKWNEKLLKTKKNKDRIIHKAEISRAKRIRKNVRQNLSWMQYQGN